MTATPTHLEEYRIVRLIGRGGMGDVYLAHDQLLDRPVAIKFIRVSKENASAREQFFLEARAAARVQHPNVCVIHRVGEWKGQPYIVSELIKGMSLAQLAVPMPEREVVEIGLGLARGLAAAHRQGVLHRDIKPANVLRSENGDIKLVDFGIAELAPTTDGPIGTQSHLRLVAEAAGSSALAEALLSEQLDAPHIQNGDTAPMRVPTPRALLSRSRSRGRSSSPLRIDTLAMLGLGSRRVVGTPDYVAPELWRGLEATRQSDVYALGAVLYELCVGEAPYGSSNIDELPHITQVESRSLTSADPSINARFSAVIDKCLHRDLSQRYASADDVREALEQLYPSSTFRNVPEGNPYRGLRTFEAEHGALFFGRNREMRAIVERVRADAFVVVAGDSGIGKSSICRAGVIPYLLVGELGEERQWTAISIVPGKQPMAALHHALGTATDLDIASTSSDSPLRAQIARGLGKGRGLIIFIDQLEELATLTGEGEAAAFCKQLDELLLSNLPIRVIATIRSDFIAPIGMLPSMGDRLGRALYLLHPMGTEGIREAIVGPAVAKGFKYESDAIVDDLLDSTKDTEEGLPLLQFALAQLWELRDPAKKIIPASALASIGGVSGALARHADAVIGQLLPKARANARRMLLSLVTAEGTRARKTPAELGVVDLETRLALESLVQARLLIVREAEGGTVYEVAHEALLSGWHTLRSWLDDSAQARVARDRVSAGTAEWYRLGQSPEALWGARQLEEVEKIQGSDLPLRETTFLKASERAIRRRKRWIKTAVIGVPLLLAMVVALAIFRERRDVWRKTDMQVREALAIIGDARGKNAVLERDRERALALFLQTDTEAAERNWDTILRRMKEVGGLYWDATQTLETAIFLSPRDQDLRSLMADILFERALIAEREGQSFESQELTKRFRSFDETGKLWRKWTARGTVTVETTPLGAKASLEVYREGEDGRLITSPVSTFITTKSGSKIELDPGSYIVTFTHDGYAPVAYPFIVRRAEQLAINIRMLRPHDIPDGFVYVPAGRSLFGARGQEDLREWLKAVPLRQIYVDSYLISRTETTFQEWLEFIESLPARQREALTPRDGTTARRGTLSLIRQGPGRWRLSLRPSDNVIVSDAQGYVHFEGRDRRKKQRWARFPVAGISPIDAEAYFSFLRSTRNVRGARLCKEQEWERAARGADDRRFPHGDRLNPEDANFDVTYKRHPLAFGPDEVGSHPLSRSVFGIDDASGNVWEFTVGADGSIVVRGGAYYDTSLTSVLSNREPAEAGARDPLLGLRVCADLPPDEAVP